MFRKCQQWQRCGGWEGQDEKSAGARCGQGGEAEGLAGTVVKEEQGEIGRVLLR